MSSTLLFVDTTKQDIFAETLNYNNSGTNSKANFDITLNFKTDSKFFMNTNLISTQLHNISNNIVSQLNINFLSHLEIFYASYNFYAGMKTLTNKNSVSVENNSVVIVQLSDSLKNELSKLMSTGSVLPVNNSQIQQAFALQTAFVNTSYYNIDFFNTEYRLNKTLINVYTGYNINVQTIPLNITGLGRFTEVLSTASLLHDPVNYHSDQYPLLSKIWEHGSNIQTYLFVNNLTRLLNHISRSSYGVFPIISSFFGGYYIDLNKIDPFQISHKLDQIQTFQYTLSNNIFNTKLYQSLRAFNPLLRVNFPNYNIYQSIANMVTSIFLNMFLYALPIFMIAFFLAYYAFDSVQKAIIKLIIIFKTRGMTGSTILLFEVLDLGIILIVATIFGSLAGIPIASVTTKTNFLLSFDLQKNYNVAQVFLANISTMFLSILALALVFNVLLNFIRVLQLSKISMNIESIGIESKNPLWKKFYLDVIILIFGFFTYIIAIYLNNSLIYTQNSFTTIAIFLLIPAPFLIIIGLLLFINRIIPKILTFFSKQLWNIQGGIFAISFKKITVQKSSSINGIILISCIISFLILFYTLPYSEVNYRQNVSLFENGSEGVLEVNYFNHKGLHDVKNLITNISSSLKAKFPNDLYEFSPYFTFQLNDYKLGTVVFKFVNSSSLLQASSLNKFNLGLQNSLSQDLHNLNTKNYSIIMNKQAFDSNLLSLNTNLTLYQYNGPFENNLVEFPIIDTYNIWPTTSRNTVEKTVYAISDMKNLLNENIDNQSLFYTVQNFGFYLKFNPNENKTQIANEIFSTLGYPVKISDFEIKNWDIYSAIIFQFQLGQINTNIIMSVIILLIILVLFGLMQVYDNKKEIFTEFALGLKPNQLGISILIQEISILFISFMIGSILGLSFIYILVVFIIKGNQIPPYEIITPWDLVLFTYSCFLLITVVLSVIIIKYISRQDLSSYLRNF